MASEDFSVEYRGHSLEISARYRKPGQELILFIHGLGCNKEFFDDAFSFPQFGGFSLLSIDLVGFGRSSKPQDFSYSMEGQAEACRLLLGGLKPTRIHIVAHSMGAAVGLLLAEKIQGTLASFVNVEGNLTGEDCGFISRRIASVPFENFKTLLISQLKGEIAKLPGKGNQLWSSQIGKSDPLAFYQSARSLVEWSDSGQLLERFRSLAARKAYVYGEDSRISALHKLGRIPLIKIPKSGHFVMADNPNEFYARLAEFIEG
ncbi:alpha/beta hydrolase [Candidatus Woesearchaeota archaeon]|nr:alpha/beta hydrolase [Candidatus Woesearchaeota archaeon]